MWSGEPAEAEGSGREASRHPQRRGHQLRPHHGHHTSPALRRQQSAGAGDQQGPAPAVPRSGGTGGHGADRLCRPTVGAEGGGAAAGRGAVAHEREGAGGEGAGDPDGGRRATLQGVPVLGRGHLPRASLRVHRIQRHSGAAHARRLRRLPPALPIRALWPPPALRPPLRLPPRGPRHRRPPGHGEGRGDRIHLRALGLAAAAGGAGAGARRVLQGSPTVGGDAAAGDGAGLVLGPGDR
mmetsp:Transcript_29626/g.71149  ORF Transcript_29626/g.71149 Transcript_29626/m.71149 type:complete len:239 (+) Transcript_29626:2843-3559(+)